MWNETKMQELLKTKIKSIFIDSEEQHYLKFMTDQGQFIYEVEGDCCSESWFADINGVNLLINATVQKVDEIDLNDYNVNDGKGRQEKDCAYAYRIWTDKGWADIIFRNSSNGYYGGWMSFYGNNDLGIFWNEITEDYSA